jgi:hypothetical protein
MRARLLHRDCTYLILLFLGMVSVGNLLVETHILGLKAHTYR